MQIRSMRGQRFAYIFADALAGVSRTKKRGNCYGGDVWTH